jgi:periplasmic divalent cation tolerance protein
MAEEVLLAISTFPDAELARSVSRQLVEQKLAACANISSAAVQSIYQWQGKIEEGQETLVLFKTTRDRFDEFARRLKALHPYEVPEIIAVRVEEGLPAYVQWVETSCAR